jgi:hypothetical protein
MKRESFPVFLSGGIGDVMLCLPIVESLNKIANIEIYTHHIAVFKLFMPHKLEAYNMQQFTNKQFKNYVLIDNSLEFRVQEFDKLPDDIKPIYNNWVKNTQGGILQLIKNPGTGGSNKLAHLMLRKGITRKLLPNYLAGIEYEPYIFKGKEDIIKPIPEDFITIHNGFDGDLRSPGQIPYAMKVYPPGHFREFVRLFKQKHPNIKIVQIGIHTSTPVEGVDINLLNKTTYEQMLGYLKHSILHIDGDSGLIHSRQFISNNPAIVLHGPTNKAFFEYENNINIKADFCGDCWQKRPDWMWTCNEGHGTNLCMSHIKPEDIMIKINEYLNKVDK